MDLFIGAWIDPPIDLIDQLFGSSAVVFIFIRGWRSLHQ